MLVAGTRLGPYEILGPLGAGGMGEVYKGRDTRLDRVVAVKVLPADRWASADARQRFEREARTVSALSHPNICALFDIGRHDTPQGPIDYLVIEYLEGETLRDRLAKGPLPLDQTLRFGAQIASALNKAHRQGIVHRDLKPANVMLTGGGVKLLDFGLAKSSSPAGLGEGKTVAPTVTHLTQEGVILGTLQYMAPEQLEGRDSDARTDIFAFGALLYEMATGKPAFHGTSQASLIVSIMKDQPAPMAVSAPMTPAALDHAVRTCLAKDPEERWQSAGDLGTQLSFIAAQSASASASGTGGSAAGMAGAAPAAIPASDRGRQGRALLPWTVALVAIALAAGVIWRSTGIAPSREASPMRFSILLPDMTAVRALVVSPDGTRIVLVGRDANGRNLLWIRPLDTLDLQPLEGTENPSFPFWSPDGRSIGFFADGKLKKIAAGGGPPQSLCDAPLNRGGTWGADGTILFAPVSDGPLYRVSSSGGAPVAVTTFDRARGESTHRWPVFLPDGRRFLYLVATFADISEQDRMGIYLGSLDSKDETFLFRANSSFAWNPPDKVLFLRDRNLFAQKLDAATMAPSGDPIPLAESIQFFPPTRQALLSTSANGTLVYQTQGDSTLARLVWLDRGGHEAGTLGAAADQSGPRLSPDGKRVALSITDPRAGNLDLWAYETTGGIPARLTTHPGVDGGPTWSPDGKRMAFSSIRAGHTGIYSLEASGGSEPHPVLTTQGGDYPTDWSPDGRFILERHMDAQSNLELWIVPVDDPGKHAPLVRGAFGASHGRFSPDGRFVAYQANETGRWEISVTAFPGPGGTWRVSSEGGTEPVWSRDGKELFYLAADGHLMAVPVRLAPTFDAGSPKPLFLLRRREPVSAIDLYDYDVAPDGRRFLVNVSTETASPPLTVVLDWAGEPRHGSRLP